MVRRWLLVLALSALAVLTPSSGAAFCGFYVSGSGGKLLNDATQVVVLRSGLRTVLSIQNDYRGPPESFALVVPVPVVLQKANVRTLDRALFDHVETLDAPRLVEYWEQDPCPAENNADNKEGGTGTRAKGEEGSMGRPAGRAALVTVEAQFSVDEYEVVILSALDATALETWLHEAGYQIPAGAERYLRPYVLAGSKFFVAKVDPSKVRFTWGRATLSPLRFFYDTESFTLPVRLGLMNASGPQDLVVHVLAPERYETANYENVFIPTNLEVNDGVRDRFASFYASLFDSVVASHPRAVVTEYAWTPSGCDPCTTGVLSDADLDQLGLDALGPGGRPANLTLTRLHARYTPDSLGEDLVFRPARPVEGGREAGNIPNLTTATPSAVNTFQARYILRHPWTGAVACASPRFGVWGGPPDRGQSGLAPMRRDAPAQRDLTLADFLVGGSRGLLDVTAPPASRLNLALGLRRLFESRAIVLGAFLVGAVFLVLSARRLSTGVVGPLLAYVAITPVLLPLYFVRTTGNAIRDGGVLVFVVVAVFVLALAATLALRLHARPGPALLVLPVLPPVTGILRATSAWSSAFSEPEAADPDTLRRLLAEREAEALAVVVVGLWLGAVLYVVAAWPQRAPRVEGGAARPPRASRFVVAALTLLGLAACAAARVAIGGDRSTGFGAYDAPLFAVVVFAGIAATQVTGGPSTHHQQRLLGFGAAAGLAAVAALLCIVQWGVGMPAWESVEASTAIHALVEMARVERLRLFLLPLDVLAAAAPLAWALHGARALPKREDLRPLAPALAALAVLLALGLWQKASFAASFGELSRGEARFDAVRAVALPSVAGDWNAPFRRVRGAQAQLDGPAVWITADGSLFASPSSKIAPRAWEPALWDELAKPSTDPDATATPLLAADAGLHVEALFRALAPLLDQRQLDFRLVVALGATADAPAALRGRLANDTYTFDVELRPRVTVTAAEGFHQGRRPTFGLLVDGLRARAVPLDGAEGVYETVRGKPPVDLDIGLSAESERERDVQLGNWSLGRGAVVAVAPSTDLGAVARALRAMNRRSRRDDLPRFVITPDTASLTAAFEAAKLRPTP